MRDQCYLDLITLFDAENASIIAGNYAVLDDLAERKLKLFDELPDAGLTPEELRIISENLQKNQKLLGAAIKGVNAARTRLSALRAVRDGLQVYDRSGHFAAHPLPRPELVKKA